jgi:hypothetical protein
MRVAYPPMYDISMRGRSLVDFVRISEYRSPPSR